VTDLGDQAFDDGIEAQATVVRTIGKVPGPGHSDGVVAGDQRIDVVRDHTARDLDRVLVVVARTLRSVTGRRVAIVNVIRRYDLVEPVRAALAVGGEVCQDRFNCRVST
jgi:hypothetical protein